MKPNTTLPKEKRSLEQLYALRKQVIRMNEQGVGIMQIVKLTGLSWPAVRVTLDKYEQGGIKAIKPAIRGAKQGTRRSLNAKQESEIQKMICDNRPEQLKMDFALWSGKAIMQLIEQQYSIKLHERSVGKYLKRWGFTPQKPIKKAYEQQSAAVQLWLDESYPNIVKQAKEQGGEIHWADETAVVNTDVRGRSYAPVGQTPVIKTVGGTRHKFSMIASVTNQGKMRWMMIEETFNSDKLIEFLEALIKDANKKVFLILDNLRVHHSKPVKAWVAERLAKIELFYLPSYSPELNPEERLNADLKHVIRTKVPARTKAKLREITSKHMTELEQSPERVKTFFQDEFVKYAA